MSQLTIGRLKELIAHVPDDFRVAASGIEGPKVGFVGGVGEPKDREFVFHLEPKREGSKGVGTYEVER